MSLRAMWLKYQTTMSPSRLLTYAEQEAIRRANEPKPPVPAPIIQVDEELESPFPDSFYTAVNLLLQYGASQNLGPTRCARLNYLWFATTAMAYQWTQPLTEARIIGIKDKWDWSKGSPLKTNEDQYVWMNHVWEAVMPQFVPSFSAGTFLTKERNALGWNEEHQATEWTRIQADGDWNGFFTAWMSWWTARQSDGSANQPITASPLPNGDIVLDVSDTVDPSTFPAPTKWTPLNVNGNAQKYLTFNWMSVRATALSGEDGTIAQNAGKAAFITDPAAKAAEIAEILSISETLTDEQKVQAEFWAGGPNTVSPPGMMIWFWRSFMQTAERTWSTLVYSGLDLAAHIFETARLVWGLKKQYMEARPIQFIRAQYRGKAITKYDGTPSTGEAWVPYQETNFVTPPFADFPSGHSAFGQSFANVMTEWFGAEIPVTKPKLLTDLSLLSPSLAGSQTQSFGTFTFPAGASLIQPTQVPASPIPISFSSWQDIANSCGISRKFGGIHATSAHVGSQALANALHNRMSMRWAIPR